MELSDIFLIGLGLLVAYYLYIMVPYWYRQGYKNKDNRAVTQIKETVYQQPIVAENRHEDSKQKGDAFEKYIVNLFNSDSGRFRLKEWRSDKMADNGMYALSNHSPDLEFAFVDGRKEHQFAIECKWRKEFQGGEIDWAKEYQIKNYLHFQRKNRVPVFVAIGVGGTPSNPEKLFIPKLDQIASCPTLYESYLKQFSRKPDHRLFYNSQQKMLY